VNLIALVVPKTMFPVLKVVLVAETVSLMLEKNATLSNLVVLLIAAPADLAGLLLVIFLDLVLLVVTEFWTRESNATRTRTVSIVVTAELLMPGLLAVFAYSVVTDCWTLGRRAIRLSLDVPVTANFVMMDGNLYWTWHLIPLVYVIL